MRTSADLEGDHAGAPATYAPRPSQPKQGMGFSPQDEAGAKPAKEPRQRPCHVTAACCARHTPAFRAGVPTRC